MNATVAAKTSNARVAFFIEPNQWLTFFRDPEGAFTTARMKEIVAQIGWPAASKFGRHTAHLAWLLVQHADQDVDFQRECLRLMREAPEGEVSRADVAYLEDRVRVHEGRPQLYGTQFHTDERGELVPRPIEDPGRLDERRAAAGLQPLAEYEQLIRQAAPRPPAS